MRPYYEAGGIAIYHGDCREVGAWTEADVLLTDPPYGMTYQSGWRDESNVANDGTTGVRDAALAAWTPPCWEGPGRPALVFGRWSVQRPAGTRFRLIWDKGDWPGMGNLSMPWGPSTEEVYVIGGGWGALRSPLLKRRGQILRDPKRPTGEASEHPTQKPVGLIEMLLAACPPGTIADPFMGSGTTLVAAAGVGRKAIGRG